MPAAQVAQVIDHARSEIRARYSTIEAARLVIGGPKPRNGRQFCSRLVAGTYPFRHAPLAALGFGAVAGLGVAVRHRRLGLGTAHADIIGRRSHKTILLLLIGSPPSPIAHIHLKAALLLCCLNFRPKTSIAYSMRAC